MKTPIHSLSGRYRINLRLWVIAGLLLLPVYLLYLAQLTCPLASGTGFVQIDQPYYMALARSYFATGHFTLTYGLPFSPDPNTPRIYFQPLTLALGLAEKLTGSDPGILYMIAGLIFALCCARVIIALYEEIIPLSGAAAWLGLICFFWGGGLLDLAGIFNALASGKSPIDEMLHFDVFEGWWFLNLGRNLVYTTEAFYHLIFLGGILLVLRRRFAWALACAALLSASHAFSGLQFLAVLGVWSGAEWLTRRGDRPPLYFPLAIGALAALHVGYYLVFLPHVSEEQRVLEAQWSLPWILGPTSMVLAYALVGVLAAIALLGQWRRARSLSAPQRLFLAWFAVSLLLVEHYLVIAPRQPLHFTRGYIWTPLFLIGAPILVRAIAAASRAPTGRFVLPAAIVGLLLFDNVSWFLLVGVREHNGVYGITLDAAEKAVIEKFREPRYAGYLVLSQHEKMGYLATVYSPLRAWFSYGNLTPYRGLREQELTRFFADGTEPKEWHDRPLIAVVDREKGTTALLETAGFHVILSDGPFTVLARDREAQG